MNTNVINELRNLINSLELEILEKQNELDSLLKQYDELTEANSNN